MRPMHWTVGVLFTDHHKWPPLSMPFKCIQCAHLRNAVKKRLPGWYTDRTVFSSNCTSVRARDISVQHGHFWDICASPCFAAAGLQKCMLQHVPFYEVGKAS